MYDVQMKDLRTKQDAVISLRSKENLPVKKQKLTEVKHYFAIVQQNVFF